DKSLPLGAANPDGTKNVDGRFAVHLHRDYWPGMSDKDPPVLVSGNFEEGAAGWGYDQHSSYADFEDNVAYENNGAGFATQAGNEIGTFNGNMAIRTTTTIASPTAYATIVQGQATNDFGKTGTGFWMQSPSVSLTNNVALDNVSGYVFWNRALSSPGLNNPRTGTVPSFDGRGVQEIPLASFSGDTAAYGVDGLQVFNHLRDIAVTDFVSGQQSVVDRFRSYATTVGIDLDSYVSSVAIENSSLTGDGSRTSVGIATAFSFTTDIEVYNDAISGFAIGYLLPTFGNDVVQGCVFNDAVAMEVPQLRPGLNYFLMTRELNFAANTFGASVKTDYLWDTNVFDLYTPEVDFIPQSLWIDGVERYFAYQAPNYVPFPSLRTSMPAAFIGLTNDQLRQRYGLVDGGFETGEQMPFSYTLLSLPNTTSPAYTLSYETPEGPVSESLVLQPGANVITRTVDGRLHSWIIDYFVQATTVQGFQGSPGALAPLPLTVNQSGSVVSVRGTFSSQSAVRGIEVFDNNFTYSVDMENGVLTIARIAPLKSVVLPPAASYAVSMTVDTGAHTISVTVNGVRYF
ncbi:MAG: hypothetical protein KGL39_51525, partial [Patescibacteria group bacterium]|nr:hypothetical protein [Patescibacteria group bacterium]